jgi:hypothetical protein
VAVTYHVGNILRGTTAERTGGTWTNLPVGWIFIESNGLAIYIWNGSTWDLITTKSITEILTGKTIDGQLNTLPNTNTFPSQGRSGAWYGGSQTGAGSGLFNGTIGTIVVGTGAVVGLQRDSTGLSHRWTSGGTINGIGGARIAFAFAERDYNPIIEFQLALQQTTTTRCFAGFTSSLVNPASGADPLNALSGVMVGYDSGVDANWHIYQNNATGTDSTTVAAIAAADTSAHKFAIKAVEASSKFQYAYGFTNISTATWVDINTKIPAATTGLGFQYWVEGLAATKTFQMYYIQHYQDK